MRINNIKNEIENFLKQFCVQIGENEELWYVESLMDNHSCIMYENVGYYIPDECSLMDENDELLKEMLIATFPYE